MLEATLPSWLRALPRICIQKSPGACEEEKVMVVSTEVCVIGACRLLNVVPSGSVHSCATSLVPAVKCTPKTTKHSNRTGSEHAYTTRRDGFALTLKSSHVL